MLGLTSPPEDGVAGVFEDRRGQRQDIGGIVDDEDGGGLHIGSLLARRGHRFPSVARMPEAPGDSRQIGLGTKPDKSMSVPNQ